jgi:3-hydroxyacyl-CoA dehydrogenase
MGLPEMSVGVVPAGGGTKEMLARAMEDADPTGDVFPHVERAFIALTATPNSTSAEEARKNGFLRPGDAVSRNADRRLYEAKHRALALANAGYTPPVQKGVWVLGEEGLARLRMPLHWAYRSGALSEHDRRIADRIAYVLSGGGLPFAQEVTEDYLLRLEREVFIELAHEPKTAERMRHILVTGKPLKN